MNPHRQVSQRTFMEVVNETAEQTGVEKDAILGRRRFKETVRARQRAMWTLHRRGYSYSAIARRWGMTHWNIMHGVQVIEKLDGAGDA